MTDRASWFIFEDANSTILITQGVKNRASFPPDVVEAYKYVFSQPGALTAPINYYRCMFRQERSAVNDRAPPRKKIEVPSLVIWVRSMLGD